MAPTQLVECLRCGAIRSESGGRERAGSAVECPRCGYLGWARAGELTEAARRVLRERPPEERRLRAV